MLQAIIRTSNIWFWLMLHIGLGMLATQSGAIFALWFFTFLLTSLKYTNKGDAERKKVNFLFMITYMVSLELLVRMSRAYEYRIPWEFGKYTMLFGFLYGIVVLGQRKGLVGFLMLFLLLPSFFLGPATETDTAKIVGNFFGPLALCLSVAYCWKLKVTRKDLQILLKLILLPCVSVLSYTLIKNPDLTEYQFELAANFATAGGFGSNQVSTVLGLGAFLAFAFWLNNWQIFKNKNYSLILFFLFGIQGLLTFSRGGMLGTLVGILTISWVYFQTGGAQKKRYHVRSISGYVLGAGLAVTIVFWVANEITGGLLELRYKGETNATLRGSQKVSLTTLTTNRSDIFLADIELWQDHFIIGTGVGGSPYLRSKLKGYEGEPIAAHVELSRLLAEHGILGLFYAVILVYLGFRVARNRGNPKYKAILLALYMLAIYTTFHAATRTFVTPLLVGLSLLKVTDIHEVDAEDLSVRERKRKRKLENEAVVQDGRQLSPVS